VLRKAAYLEFENDSELEFEHFLALQLNMTVARLRREMSNDEMMRWSVYFGRRTQEAELAAKRQTQAARQQARRR